MALKKEFPQFDGVDDNGIKGNYVRFARVISPCFDMDSENGWGQGVIEFEVYLSEDARREGKKYIRLLQYIKPWEWFGFSGMYDKPTTAMGIYMRKSEFLGLEDAEDILEIPPI